MNIDVSLIKQLRKLFADNIKLQAENEKYKKVLEHIIEYWNRDRNDKAMYDALWHIIETAEQALKGE